MNRPVLIGAGIFVALLLVVAGIRIGLLIRSVSSYKTYWQKEAAKTPDQGVLIYIALGDSTAQGIGASSPRRGYVGLVAEYLQVKTGKPVHVINISVSGAKISDAIKTQLPQLKNLPKPDYVTIEIGANDMQRYDEQTFTQEFQALLNDLPTGTYVSNMPSFKGGRYGKLNDNAIAASRVISSLLVQRTDLSAVDVYGATSGQNLRDFGADLFHPSNNGYKNWGYAFMTAIDAN